MVEFQADSNWAYFLQNIGVKKLEDIKRCEKQWLFFMCLQENDFQNNKVNF